MITTDLTKVSSEKFGRILLNNAFLESHEYRTILFLAEYGFDIEVLCPSGTPKSNNPDIYMLGTIWEIKALFRYNQNTMKRRFKKASHQSDHIIVDLRNIKNDSIEAAKYAKQLFEGSRTLKRMILITPNKSVDFKK